MLGDALQGGGLHAVKRQHLECGDREFLLADVCDLPSTHDALPLSPLL